ncbi:MAG: cytochrome c oxidase accessory protein CcoG [Pseudomonadota bacterium]
MTKPVSNTSVLVADRPASKRASKRKPQLIDAQELLPAELGEVDLYQRREKIYTRSIEGFYQRLRMFTGWPLLFGYFVLPWLRVDGRQAVWFDLPSREFHIFWLTLWPQDLSLLAFLLIIAAFSLFAVTVVAGRVWCGYTCPQTVWTAMFMWIEQKCEGTRNQRIKLDKQPMSFTKARKKISKHLGWFGLASFTGLTFVGYFYPIRDLSYELLTLSTGIWQWSWTLFFTLATYINAGWMREQVCMYMCPYARFQSVMFDKDTLVVSYDAARGDPRGSRKRSADPQSLGLGDCIDCDLCVQVCPVGIDIRDGLQYQCIGCAHCVDACNTVMKKMGYDSGLVNYTSEHRLEGGETHWIRGRVVGYCVAILLAFGVFTYLLLSRVPLEVTIIRDRNALFVETADGGVENIYQLRVVNMDPEDHDFRLSIEGITGARIQGADEFRISGGEDRDVYLRVKVGPEDLAKAGRELTFELEATDKPGLKARSESRFMKPIKTLAGGKP